VSFSTLDLLVHYGLRFVRERERERLVPALHLIKGRNQGLLKESNLIFSTISCLD
jgi:hypothetical protein